jgi:hypothetical protein
LKKLDNTTIPLLGGIVYLKDLNKERV